MNTNSYPYFGSASGSRAMKLERVKIAFQFLLMTVCSLIIGFLISGALSDGFYEKSVLGVSSHFETLFIDCSEPYDYISCIALYSVYDIICIAVVFFVSFAAFNYVATDFVLIYNGTRFGLAVSFLSAFIDSQRYSYGIGIIRYIVFIFFKTAILILLFGYSYRAAILSGELRRMGANGRIVINPKTLLYFLLYTFANIGSVLLLNGLYCWLIYILK